MEITEVRVSLREQPQTRLKAYVTLTFDNCFVVRNIKIIEGKHGLFVAMSSRKPRLSCTKCHFKPEVGSHYCSQCGSPVSTPVAPAAGAGDLDLPDAQAHRDIAHPITGEFRAYLQRKILDAYEAQKAHGTPSPSPEARGPESQGVEFEAL